MAQLIKKLKRKQKVAYKFRFKLTYSALSVTHEHDWNPGKLVVRWSRGHRHVVSTSPEWTPGVQATESGIITGNGLFEPPCTVDLLVTLYKDQKSSSFEEKDYKFTLEDEGDPSGRKTLGVFSVNIAQFADMIGSQNDVTMELKPIFKKVQEALLDASIQSEFLKTGKLGDDDMMSTWSAMSELIETNNPDDDTAAGQISDDSITLESSTNLLRDSTSSYELRTDESYIDWLCRTTQDDIINNENENIKLDIFKDAKVIGIFFGSNTSEPSKSFCTFLDSFSNHLNESRSGDFQLLFVSCDYSDAEMLDFMQDTGIIYPGLKSSSQIAEVLREKFDISVIPTLVIVKSGNGDLIDRDAKLKVERCVGNEEIDEIFSYWLDGNPYPLKQEPIGLNVLQTSQSIDGDKAKIISKEERRKQERLDKEKKKREEEEKRRKEKLDKEEKKKLDREEKRKIREKERQEKINKKVSTPNASGEKESRDSMLNLEDPDVLSTDINVPSDVELNDYDDKPTLLQVALPNTTEKNEIEFIEEAIESPSIKTKDTEKFIKEEKGLFSMKHKNSENQLKEALKHLSELKATHDFLQENNRSLIESKVLLENEKEDLQERLNDINVTIEEKNDQIADLLQNVESINKEITEKGNKIELLQDEKLALKENLDGVRVDNDSLRTEVSQLKIQLLQFETEKKVQEEETLKLNASIQLCGWLYKRGVRGPTGKKWRRRYFDASEGFKLQYYKSSAKGVPQGHIDLEQIVDVVPQVAEKQDKNSSSFNVQVEGRMFELQAYDQIMRDQWINAIKFLTEYIKKYRKQPPTPPKKTESTSSYSEVTQNGASAN